MDRLAVEPGCTDRWHTLDPIPTQVYSALVQTFRCCFLVSVCERCSRSELQEEISADIDDA